MAETHYHACNMAACAWAGDRGYDKGYDAGIAEGLRRAASTIEDSAARLESSNENTAAAIRATAVAWVAGLRISAKPAKDGADA